MISMVAMILLGCGSKQSISYDLDYYDEINSEDEQRGDFSDDTGIGMFHGNDCTDDCSGHEAGYEWAMTNDITDPDDCDSPSDSFTEGCQSYIEDN